MKTFWSLFVFFSPSLSLSPTLSQLTHCDRKRGIFEICAVCFCAIHSHNFRQRLCALAENTKCSRGLNLSVPRARKIRVVICYTILFLLFAIVCWNSNVPWENIFFFVIHFQAEVFFFRWYFFVQYLLKRRSDMRHKSVDRDLFSLTSSNQSKRNFKKFNLINSFWHKKWSFDALCTFSVEIVSTCQLINEC